MVIRRICAVLLGVAAALIIAQAIAMPQVHATPTPQPNPMPTKVKVMDTAEFMQWVWDRTDEEGKKQVCETISRWLDYSVGRYFQWMIQPGGLLNPDAEVIEDFIQRQCETPVKPQIV